VNLPPPLNEFFDEEQALFREKLRDVSFAAGERIFRAGDRADGCYIIKSGEVRLEVEVERHVDTDCVIGYITAGSLLGEQALLDDLPRSATAYAETTVEAAHLSSAAIEDLCARHPHLGMGMFRAFGRDASIKLRQSTERLADFIATSAPDPDIDAIVAQAAQAQRQLESWSEEQTDALLQAIASAIADRAEELAIATVQETRIGNISDKTRKNVHASLGVYQFLAGKRGWGVLDVDTVRGVMQIASPVGVVFALVPVTNPVATIVFKTLICIKARCTLILNFNRGCMGVANSACEIIERALNGHGAPNNLVQWVRARSSRVKTFKFMKHPGVSLILATGGAGMVKAAYSSGKPAIGGGPGNVPTYIAADADIERAAHGIVGSKTYDNGLICGAEHNLIVHARVRDKFVAALQRYGAAVLTDEEVKLVEAAADSSGEDHLDARMIGRSASSIAARFGFMRSYPVALLVAPITRDHVKRRTPLVREKLMPLVSLLQADSDEEAFAICEQILRQEGIGHTAIIHTESLALAERFGLCMPAGRILVNSPGAQGIAGVTTGLIPSYTLGCGTFGGNSTTDNVSYHNLQNIKRLAYLAPPSSKQ
jgi:acyl-CoA reductase-like NAD-dependent aldehyde dehydrogenase